MMILSNEDIRILKYSFFISIILAILLTIPSFFLKWWNYGFGLSILIGYLSSAISYYKLVVVTTKVTNFEYENPKRAFVFNNLTSLLIYFVALLICTLIEIFNIFLCALGIVIIKIMIIALYGKNKKNNQV